MSRARWCSRLAIGLVGPCALLAAEPAGAAAKKPYGGELRQARLEEVGSTDPARVESPLELEVARQVHETLWRCPLRGEALPAMALGPARLSDDRRELTIQLRPDVVFHDGAPVGADELIASWERLLRPETGSRHWWLLAPLRGALGFRRGKLTRLTGVEKLNRLSLRLRLELPMPGFLEALCALPTAPLPTRLLQRPGALEAHPVGTGPFKVVGGEPAAPLELRASLAHFRGRPYLDALVWQPFREGREAALAFELGRLQRLVDPPVSRPADEPRETGPIQQVTFLVIQRARLAAAPEGLRQAIEHAIDRRALVEYVLGEAGRATDEALVVPADAPGGGTAAEATRSNPIQARAYFQKVALQRMGLPLMLEFIVRAWRPLERAVADRIQVALLDAGASLAVVPLDREAYARRLAAGQYDFRLEEPLPLVRDLELQLIGLVAQAQGEEATEQLLKDMASLPGGPSRAGMLRERARQPRLLNDWVPLYARGGIAARRASVRGGELDAAGVPDWAEAWLAE